MDVTCEHCEAEYEFDETLLSDKGTTVKCSACAHVFRVMPPQHEGSRAPLKLRRARGGEEQLGSLRELQQRIRDGDASLDDEIGRDGPFRRLRDVPELKNFFARTPDEAEGTAAAPGTEPKTESKAASLLGSPPTERPPAPARGSALPEVIEEPARSAKAGTEDKADRAAKRTMLGVGPLDPPHPPLPVHDDAPTAGAGDREPSDAQPVGRAPAPRRAAAAHSTPTLLGTPVRTGSDVPLPAPSPSAPALAPVPPRAPMPNVPIAPRVPSEDRGQVASLPRVEPAPSPTERGPEPRARAAPVAPPSASAPASWAPKVAASAPAPAPALAGAAQVRLYLADDEAAPARAMGSSSRLWLVALLLLVGAGGWIGVHALSSSGGDEVSVGRMATAPTPATTAPVPPAAGSAAATSPPPPTPTPTPASTPTAQPAGERTPTQSQGAAAATSKPPLAAKPQSNKSDTPAATASAQVSERPSKPEREREPEDYGQLVSKASQLSSKGDHGAAIKTYQAALALRPTGSEANSGLGFALLKANKPNEALPLFDRAASSGFVDANIGLGDAFRKLGQSSSALEAYRTYLEQQPAGTRSAYARTWVEKLEKGAGDAPAHEPSLPPEEAPAARDDYRPAGELMAPSEQAAPPIEPEQAPPASADEGSEL